MSIVLSLNLNLNLKQTLKLFLKVTLIMSPNLCINNLYAKIVMRTLNMMDTFKVNLISCIKIFVPNIYRKIYVL